MGEEIAKKESQVTQESSETMRSKLRAEIDSLNVMKIKADQLHNEFRKKKSQAKQNGDRHRILLKSMTKYKIAKSKTKRRLMHIASNASIKQSKHRL